MIRISCLAATCLFIALSAAYAATPDDFRSWIDSPEAYFATGDERAAWAKVTSREEADRFLAGYRWKRGPGFTRELQARVGQADRLFSLAKIQGSLTPMGRVFIILGSPNRQQVIRSETEEIGPAGQLQNNPAERANVRSTRWIYQSDRLPKELGVPELTVRFQTDTARGYQVIENPGNVEPYLKRAGAWFSEQRIVEASRQSAPPATPVSAAVADPLWAAGDSPGGTLFIGESFIAPNGKPFHAVSFYVPKEAAAFAPVTGVKLIALVKNAVGAEVAAVRETVPLAPYAASGDRFVDRAFPLEPGNYSGVFSLATLDGTTLAIRHADFHVPAPTDARISALLPTGMIERHETQTPFEPFTFVATKYAVKADRRFTVADKVGFFTVVENPGGEPQPEIMMTISLFKGGRLLEKTPPSPVGLTQTAPHSWLIGPLFDAGTFQPGAYALELQLRDVKAPKDAEGKWKSYTVRSEFEVVN